MAESFLIEKLSLRDFDKFISYMNDHLSENGTPGTGYFQPLSRSVSSFPFEKQAAFRAGLEKSVHESGWRRTWIVWSNDKNIIGHVDLRGYPDQQSTHRCLLGMGVHSLYRRHGIGGRLMTCAMLWARDETHFDWIDLQVISSNSPAISLYQKAGFKKVGEINDLFRIDGYSFSYTTMTVPLKASTDAMIHTVDSKGHE